MADLLQQAHDLDQRARAAGLPGILPEQVRIGDSPGFLNYWADHWVPTELLEAAVREWLRQWLDNRWTYHAYGANAETSMRLIGEVIENTEAERQHAGETGGSDVE